MAELLNFVARIGMLQPFLFPLEWCHGLITWPCLRVMNGKFQTVPFYPFPVVTNLSHSVCRTEETRCLMTFSNPAHTQKSGNWHLFLPIRILWFFLLPISNTVLENSRFNSQILGSLRHQLPFLFCDFEQFFWVRFPYLYNEDTFLFASLHYCDYPLKHQ